MLMLLLAVAALFVLTCLTPLDAKIGRRRRVWRARGERDVQPGGALGTAGVPCRAAGLLRRDSRAARRRRGGGRRGGIHGRLGAQPDGRRRAQVRQPHGGGAARRLEPSPTRARIESNRLDVKLQTTENSSNSNETQTHIQQTKKHKFFEFPSRHTTINLNKNDFFIFFLKEKWNAIQFQF